MENSTKKKFYTSNLDYIEKIAKLLDSKFKILGIRFGIDPIIGMIPWLGAGVTFVIQGLLAIHMIQNGASSKVAVKMILNVIIDTILTSIPVIGNVGDVFFKANNKNVRLLKEHYHEGKHQGSAKGIIISLLLFFFALLAAIIYGTYKLIDWLIHFATMHWPW